MGCTSFLLIHVYDILFIYTLYYFTPGTDDFFYVLFLFRFPILSLSFVQIAKEKSGGKL